jgi:hypothetical protein
MQDLQALEKHKEERAEQPSDRVCEHNITEHSV